MERPRRLARMEQALWDDIDRIRHTAPAALSASAPDDQRDSLKMPEPISPISRGAEAQPALHTVKTLETPEPISPVSRSQPEEEKSQDFVFEADLFSNDLFPPGIEQELRELFQAGRAAGAGLRAGRQKLDTNDDGRVSLGEFKKKLGNHRLAKSTLAMCDGGTVMSDCEAAGTTWMLTAR